MAMAEHDMERLAHRLDELEKKSNEEIGELKANLKQAQEKNEASELKLGQLERRIGQQSSQDDDHAYLLDSNNNRGGPKWQVIGSENQVASNAFKQLEFKLPNDLCSVFCATEWNRFPFWLSLLVIAGLQFSLFILLLIDRAGSKRWIGVGGECDVNESILCRFERPLGMPPNVEPLVRAAQALCLVFALYDQQGVSDGLQGCFAGMPVDYKGSLIFRNMTLAMWNLTCFLRFLKGFLGVLCAFVLLIQAETVFDVILNFLGVKFIAEMDKLAFNIARKGYFGGAMQEAAEGVGDVYFRREEDTRPWMLRNFHVIVLLILLALLVAWFAHLSILQSSGKYLAHHFSINFGKDPLLSVFNGCYSASKDGLMNSRLSYSQYGLDAKIGFCKKADKSENGGWTLYFGSSPCPSAYENEVLAVSGPTKSFDLPLVDPTKWYKTDLYDSHAPVEVVRIDEYHSECYDPADTPEEPYFDSKCIAFNATNESQQKHFEMLVTEPSDEYPCRDPTTCRPIYVSKPEPHAYLGRMDIIYFTGHFWAYSRAGWDLKIDYTGEDLTKDDIRNFFFKGDGFNIETQNDISWAKFVTLPEEGSHSSPLNRDWYEADSRSISYYKSESEYVSYYLPYADLGKPVDLKFECVGGYTDVNRRCFETEETFSNSICLCNDPLPHDFDRSTPQAMAVQDIKNDRRASELCADRASMTFEGWATEYLLLERYALAVVMNTFGIESQGWDGDDCTSWLGDTVQLSCDNETSVRELIFLDSDTVKHSGTIPPELGFLMNLEHLDMGQNDIIGQIPEEIGYLHKLTHLDLFDCNLSGTIPAEFEHLWDLKTLYLSENKLSGQIPNFGLLDYLEVLSIYNNSLTGTIPADIELRPNLICFAQGNSISGTSSVCQL